MRNFRFVYMDGKFNWKHPAEIKANAVDCTNMNDAEFEAFVTSVTYRQGELF